MDRYLESKSMQIKHVYQEEKKKQAVNIKYPKPTRPGSIKSGSRPSKTSDGTSTRRPRDDVVHNVPHSVRVIDRNFGTGSGSTGWIFDSQPHKVRCQ